MSETQAPEPSEDAAPPAKDVEAVRASGFFDEPFYRAQVPAAPAGTQEAVRHYLMEGEAAGLAPSPFFDPRFYLTLNPDVAAAGVSPLLHFIRKGQSEARYPNREELRLDAEALVADGLVLPDLRHPDGRLIDEHGLSALEAHLGYGWRRGAQLLHDFQDRFYAGAYPDARTGGKPPLIHFLRTGQAQHRFPSKKHLKAAVERIQEEFDEEFYRAGGLEDPRSPDGATDYLLHGWRRNRDPNAKFSVSGYLRNNPDIIAKKIEPFGHFVRSGRKEGRQVSHDALKHVQAGAKRFEPDRPVIVVALHEASLTGAPLLGLEIGRKLAEEANVVFVTHRAGALLPDMLRLSCFTAVADPLTVNPEILLEDLKRSFPDCAILLNSVETVELASAALVAGLPSVALVHEFADYTLPPGKISRMVALADVAVAPAKVVAESIEAETRRLFQAAPLNLRIRHQGRLESLGEPDTQRRALSVDELRRVLRAPEGSGVKVVLGAGHVQPRKGVDLFVQTAAELRRHFRGDFRFLWVGSGYEPQLDMAASVWVKAAMARLGVGDLVTFLPHQPDLESCFRLCDLFYLPSRLDPFPNVAVDALAAGRRIVCFSGATGIADWIGECRIEGEAVGYGDVAAAAAAIARTLEGDSFSAANAGTAERDFRMDDYVADLRRFLAEAAESRRRLAASVAAVGVPNGFDHDFYTAGAARPFPPTASTLDYVAKASKGLVTPNSRPGFNEGAFRAAHKLWGTGTVPLEHALARDPKRRPTTHRCILLDRGRAAAPPIPVAIHVHLHYPELAEEFLERAEAMVPQAHLFLTVSDERGRREVDYVFRKRKDVAVDVLPNAGRDVLPMLHVLKRHDIAGRYAVFGHFHGKKTAVLKGTTGDRWRGFLMDTLMGARTSTAELLDLFAREPKLGLLFPEDRNPIGWTENRAYAEALAARLSVKLSLPDYPIFPVGTMFWARPAILTPLVDQLDWLAAEIPLEPLPYDGTLLHAIERMLPALAEAAGFTWATVRRPGIERT